MHERTAKYKLHVPLQEQQPDSNTDSLSSLEVVQFHFIGWPDHGVPQNGVVLINYIRRVRTIHPHSDPQPLLVHCSAGVGRTGAFVVLDSMLERMKQEDNLNIFEFLKQLRAQRVLMVQTQV
jgi:netrin-G3 ligand